MINVDACKKRHVCEKDYVWNPATCNCENGKYLASIRNDPAIMCDEIIESYTKLSPKNAKLSPKDMKLSPKENEEETNFNEKKQNNLYNAEFLYFTRIFIIYYSIIDSC